MERNELIKLLELWAEFYTDGMDPEDTRNLYLDTLAAIEEDE
jgi:hypothetical protein